MRQCPVEAVAHSWSASGGLALSRIGFGVYVTVRPDPLAEAQRSAQDVLKVAHKDALKDSHDAGDGVDGGCSPPGLVG